MYIYVCVSVMNARKLVSKGYIYGTGPGGSPLATRLSQLPTSIACPLQMLHALVQYFVRLIARIPRLVDELTAWIQGLGHDLTAGIPGLVGVVIANQRCGRWTQRAFLRVVVRVLPHASPISVGSGSGSGGKRRNRD